MSSSRSIPAVQAALEQTKGSSRKPKHNGQSRARRQRDTPLAKEQAIARSQLDTDTCAAAQAVVQAAKANVEQAQLNIEWTKVTSLISGMPARAGRLETWLVQPQCSPGVASGPLKAYFTVSMAAVHGIPSPVSNRGERRGAAQAHSSAVDPPDGSVYERTGSIFFADREVNPQLAPYESPASSRIPTTCFDQEATAACARR
jgi:membrane fusion protein (multidrug efflux system)